MEDTTSLQAELWAISKGLELVQKRKITQVIVETDSSEVAKLLSIDLEATHSNRAIISCRRKFMEQNHIPIVHTLREGNQCADFLANLGVQQQEHFVELVAPPPHLAKYLLADLANIAFSRNSI